MDPATSETAGDSVSAISGVMHRHEDTGISAAENKKSKLKQVKGRKDKHEEATMQLRSTCSSIDRNEQRAEATATAAVTDEVVTLRQLVLSQQDAIRKLQDQLNFVLSYIGIDDTGVLIDDTTHPDSDTLKIIPSPEREWRREYSLPCCTGEYSLKLRN
jgi:flagellar hook-basal body complex protein FliE